MNILPFALNKIFLFYVSFFAFAGLFFFVGPQLDTNSVLATHEECCPGDTHGVDIECHHQCPSNVGGSVTDTSGNPLSGATVTVTANSGSGGASGGSATTGADGTFLISIYDNSTYTVEITSVPSGYLSTPKTTTSGHTKNYCNNVDTPLDSEKYECQQRLGDSGSDSCADFYDGARHRCNFKLENLPPTPVPSPSPSPEPGTPTVSVPACIDPDYRGNDVSISWTDSDVTYVDIATTANAWTYFYNKRANGLSTTAPNGFQDGQTPRNALVLQPDTEYKVRTYNGSVNSPNATFNIPACAEEIDITISIEATDPIGGFLGSKNTSGARPNTGVGWINPFEIELIGNPAELVAAYYIIFYDKSQGSNGNALCTPQNGVYNTTCVSTFISEIKDILDTSAQNGYLLRYEVTDVDGDGQTGYRVWRAGAWRTAIQDDPITVNSILTFTPLSGSNAGTRWRIRLEDGFDSKDMYTPIYAIDIIGRVAFDHDATLEYPVAKSSSFDVRFLNLSGRPSSN